MFESALVRLTLVYMGIIMLISVGFSVVLYQTSNSELERNLHRPGIVFNPNGIGATAYGDLNDYREELLTESRRHLLLELTLANLATLVAAGVISYLLARRTLQPIEEAMEAQSRFTADASHELRTPLTAMQSEIEVALRGGKLTREEAKQLLESNLEEIAKLKALSDGLLQLTGSDTQSESKEPVVLADVAAEAVKSVQAAAKAKQITITNEVGDEEIMGLRHSLMQLLVILLDNAIKYSDKGASVGVSSRVSGRQVRIEVTDTGQGIKASDLPHIFDRFYRADTSRSKIRTDGYGLGLSIARKIVGYHGGAIEASSKLGQGSRFTIQLPLNPSS